MKINTYDLKRKNLSLVEFPTQFNIKSWAVQTINKPKFTNGEWENIKIKFADPIEPSISQGLFRIIEFLKSNISDNKALFIFYIHALDSTGKIVEEWVINVEKILTINFGEVDYSCNAIQTPYMIIKPLDCILNY